MRTGARRLGILLRVLAGLLVLGGMADPAVAQTQLTCAEVGGTCRTLDEGPASGEVLDNSGSCAFEGGPIKKCYAPAACADRGGACQVGSTVCSTDTTKLGNASCSSGPCCTLPTAGPTCGELLGHENGVCSIYSDSCPPGYVNRGPTKDPCLSCCELATTPPPPPAPPEGEEYRLEFLHTDALGSVRMVTNQAGAVVSRQDYYPFGEQIPADANGREVVSVGYSESPNLRQKFTGKERDGESRLDYFGARYYSGAQGRFITPDAPFADQDPGDPQSWSLYAYARNNPLKYIDRDGRGIETAWDVLSVGLGLKSLRENVKAGNYGRAAIDAVGIGLDALAAAAPFIPGGAGALLKVIRAEDRLDDAADLARTGDAAVDAAEGSSDVAAAGESFFEGTKYSPKVLKQMELGDFHAFPEGVGAFEKNGVVSTLKGGDGVVRQVLRIPGEYKGKSGFFEYIKEADGTINHRYFKEAVEPR